MFVLVSNHFLKYFLVNVDIWLRMKNKFFGNFFQLTVSFNGFDLEIVWIENFYFKQFPDSCAKRERSHQDHATNLEPRALWLCTLRLRRFLNLIKYSFDFDFKSHPDHTLRLCRRTQSPDHAFDFAEITPQDRTDCTETALIALRSHPRIAPRSHQSLSFPIWCHRPPLILIYLSLSLPSSLNLTGFDELFWLGFVSVFIYWEMVLYICLEAEKMWGTRRKCVFYIIFSNTTKH